MAKTFQNLQKPSEDRVLVLETQFNDKWWKFDDFDWRIDDLKNQIDDLYYYNHSH